MLYHTKVRLDNGSAVHSEHYRIREGVYALQYRSSSLSNSRYSGIPLYPLYPLYPTYPHYPLYPPPPPLSPTNPLYPHYPSTPTTSSTPTTTPPTTPFTCVCTTGTDHTCLGNSLGCNLIV